MERSFFSAAYINQLVSAYSARRQQAAESKVIAAERSGAKEFEPRFELSDFEFYDDTRTAHIEIIQTQPYRTIERYVTRDYQRYPIYSDVKERTKKINKTLKLTNAVLENLPHNPDPLIRHLAVEIVGELGDEKIYPSWFLHWTLKQNCHDKKNELRRKLEIFRQNGNAVIVRDKEREAELNEKIATLELQLEKWGKKRKRRVAKAEFIKKSRQLKRSIIFGIITFGIFAYYISESRLTYLRSKLATINEKILGLRKTRAESEREKNECLREVKETSASIAAKEKETIAAMAKADERLERLSKGIRRLPMVIANFDDSFVPLKALSGIEYKKIVGCYLIHNRENDRYYVGQSKDVMKRLKQHFRGTVPNNVIFAQDYYSSEYEHKEDLFEVKIVPCSTKDELDRKEREYIRQYDANGSGYNSTSGNK